MNKVVRLFPIILLGSLTLSLVTLNHEKNGLPIDNLGEIASPGLVAYAASYSDNITSEPQYSTQNTKTFQYLNLGHTLEHYRGDSVKVGIIDSGINYDHEDFMVNSQTKVKGDSKYYEYQSSWLYYKASSHGYNYIDDTLGHGTNVAATVAAAVNSVGGLGLAPNVELYVYKVTNSNNGYEFGAIQNALMDAKTLGLDVINMSFQSYEHAVSYGGSSMAASSGCSAILTTYLNQAYNAGITLVGAAGNFNTDEPSYPGSNNHVINVGSLNQSGTDKAGFSNYGSTIDLVAPGYVHVADKGTNSSYKDTSGTSFSAPLVTAAIALYKQKNPSATPAAIESALYASCDPIDDSGSEYTNWAGNGALNVAKFLGVDEENAPTDIVINNPEVVNEELELEVGDTLDLDWTVNGNGTFDDSVNFYALSGEENVVSISSSGKITAVGEGSDYVVIESNADSSVYASVYVTVTAPSAPIPTVTSVTLNKNALALVVNGTETLTATVNGENNPSQAVNWTTSNSSIATVSSSGLVTGKAIGTATITATSALDNTKSASCTVTVSAAPSTQTLVITRSSFATSGGYAWYDWSQSGVSGKAELYTTTTTSMQFNKSKGDKVAAIYNTTAIPGSITKIEATSQQTTIRSWTAYVTSTACSASGSTLTFGSNKTTVGSASPAVGTSTSFGTSSAGYSYFCIQENETSASYISEFKITYVPKTVSSISVSGQTTSFSKWDTFSFGGTVTANYTDSTSSNVTSAATFTGYDMTTVGQQTVTVTYSNKSTTYTITVSEAVLDHLTLSGQTTSYKKGDTFAFTGTCKAVFENGHEEDVTSSVTVSSPVMTKVGNKTVTVSYTYNNVEKSASYEISVGVNRIVIKETEASGFSVVGTITYPSNTETISVNTLSTSTSGYTTIENNSIRLGSGSNTGTITVTSTTANISKIVVNAKAYGSDSGVTLTIGGTSKTLSSNYSDYEKEYATAVNSVAIATTTSKKRANIQTITVYTGASGTVETDISNSEDVYGLEVFIDTYLHMDDYTENKGWCKDTEHNYYGKNTSLGAKAAFNNLNAHQRELFTTNSAYTSEWARLSAWAEANGDSLKATNILGAYRYKDAVTYSSDNTNVILIGVLVAITFIGVSSGVILTKKRREE